MPPHEAGAATDADLVNHIQELGQRGKQTAAVMSFSGVIAQQHKRTAKQLYKLAKDISEN